MKQRKIPYYLPVAPMVPWIKERVELETMEGFALRCQVSSRRFNEILNGRATCMSFENVDKMLANEGSRTIIDFFPEYAEDSFLDSEPEAKRIIEPKRHCTIEGCERGHHSKGYCDRHYRKFKRGKLPV